MTKDDDGFPKVLSSDEIELYLSGDRRQVDRLILTSLNHISSTLIEHTKREDGIWDAIDEIGGLEGVKTKSDFVDSLIERNKSRAAAWSKIAQSSATWALLALLAFLAQSVWTQIKAQIKL